MVLDFQLIKKNANRYHECYKLASYFIPLKPLCGQVKNSLNESQIHRVKFGAKTQQPVKINYISQNGHDS